MKKLFVVVSSIETDNRYPFNFGERRSAFTDADRFRQTIFTLQSIRNSYPTDKIIVLDCSENNWDQYKEYVSYFDAEYIPYKQIDPEGHKIVTTHESINYCECYMLSCFFSKQKTYLKQFDFIIKATARYTYSQFQDLFTEEHKDKFFFKKPIPFEWNTEWGYEMIDRRNLQGNNLLYQYCTVLYGFGVSNLNKMIDLYDAHNHIVTMTLPLNINYDIESLSYFLTRPFSDDIIETDWKIMGFEGVHGRLMYY